MTKWNLPKKIWALLGASWLVGMGSAGFLLYQLRATMDSFQDLESHDLHYVNEVFRLGIEFKAEVQEWKDTLLRGTDPADLKKYTDAFRERSAKVRDMAAKLSDEVAMPDARQALQQFVREHDTLTASYEKALSGVVSSKGASAHQADRSVRGQDRPVITWLDQATDKLTANSQARVTSENAAAQRLGLYTLAAVALTFALLCASSWLTVRAMLQVLRNSTKHMTEGSSQVASASSQVAAASQTLAAGASESASSLEEISATLEQIAAMTRRNSDNSVAATAMMAETATQVDRSNRALAEMVASMDAIKASSEKVARINKTIDEIAFQTNILALNAAVEAARAGQAGMGFAVVADEVRTLAQRAAAAAKDTATLIEEALANSSRGAQTLDQVGEAIRGITASAAKVKNLVDEVTEASKQQTEGVSQVTTAVTQIATVTQSTAASAEESAAASEEMNGQAESLRAVAHELHALVDGDSGEGEAGRPEERRGRPPRATQGLSQGGLLTHRLPAKAYKKVPAKAAVPAARTESAEHHGDKTGPLTPPPRQDDPFPMETTENFRNF